MNSATISAQEKLDLIKSLVKQHDEVIKLALEKHHVREELTSNDCVYTNHNQAFPESINNWSHGFMKNLIELAKVI